MNPATAPVYRPRSEEVPPADDRQPISAQRMYLAEPGWRLSVKAGNDREFCYTMMPGQDFYHRLLDGEIFLQRHDEKLCLACASRRGLLVAEPRRLREAVVAPPLDLEEVPFDLGPLDRSRS